eukprot:TRINITY_DN13520_c0_g1_i1.p1 TRINITY_DN13520_c0_g1~~TRINITY_DN13520_c0_g1_i1.p1  ORF type:complete len:476 (+),score=178.74 TRINITY_DN13520_c0_g1_i1:158-1585(+)
MAPRYEGELNKKGQPHGTGTAKWGNGNVYTGTWCNGAQHGAGKFSFRGGDSYEGQVKYGKRDGHGVYRYADGGVYEGAFVDDLEEGEGKRTWDTGEYYEGGWKRGEMEGRAVAVSGNGDRYAGWFAASAREGKGRLDRADGSTYIGYWVDGVREGRGTLLMRNGDGYHGAWAGDAPHGEGTWYFSTPAKPLQKGVWVKGVLNDEFKPKTQPRPGSCSALSTSSADGAPAPVVNDFNTDTHWWLEELWNEEALSGDHWLSYPDPGTATAEEVIADLAAKSPYNAASAMAADEADAIGASPTRAAGKQAAALHGSRRRLAREVYLDCCRQRSLAPSKGIVDVLPAKATTHDVIRLDISHTYSGETGLLCFMQFLQQCPHIYELALQRQSLTPKCIAALCTLLETHPALKNVDLSHNFMAHADGKRLAHVCSTTPKVENIILEGTRLNRGVVTQIAVRCTANKKHNFLGCRSAAAATS